MYLLRLLWAGILIGLHLTLLLASKPRDASQSIVVAVSVGTTASVSLLLMTLIHLMPSSPPAEWTRKINQLDSLFLVLLAWLVIPSLLVKSLIESLPHHTRLHKILWKAMPLCIAAALLLWSLLLVQTGHLLGVQTSILSFEDWMGRIAALGVFLASSLAGFGSISFPLKHLRLLFTSVSPEDVVRMESKIQLVLHEKHTKQQQLDALRASIGLPQNGLHALHRSHTTPEMDMKARGIAFDAELAVGLDFPDSPMKGGDVMRNIRSSETEISDLQRIADDLMTTFETLRDNRRKSAVAKTLMAQTLNAVAWLMVGACVYRVSTALINVAFALEPGQDPATVLSQSVCSLLKLDVDPAYWAAYVSLLYVGFLVYRTITDFFQRVRIFMARLPGRLSPNVAVLLVLEVQCLYFSSCALLLRANLPEEHRHVVSVVWGEDFSFGSFHRQFDLIFALACFVSVGLAIFDHQNWRATKSALDQE